METLFHVALSCAITALVGLWLSRAIMRRRGEELARVVTRICSGNYDDLPRPRSDAFRVAYEELGALVPVLKKRAREVAQREQLLGGLVEGAPMASVLLTNAGRILHTNRAARELFFEGQDPKDGNFLGLLAKAPEALRRAVSNEGDELFSLDDDEQTRQVYHLAKRHFEMDGEPVVLVVVNNLTRELHKQEAEVWKRMIRIMAHELNNSLAPISSMIHSARILARGAAEETKLGVVFDTVAERAEHLRSFLEGFAQFARLPAPRKVDVEWRRFLDGLATMWPSLRIEGDVPEAKAWFDPAQIQQVLINLLKNAEEAGGPENSVVLVVGSADPGAARLIVRDRGQGMSPDVMKNALLPFYSTKESGTGLGLPLCREIVEAHGGVLRLEGRDEGGLDVIVRLPSRSATASGLGRLTLTRS
jgi:nitrogen fixation/metabolism regulation signal transduction histidine kinase